MGQVRNDTGEVRVMPALDYAGWEPGRVLEVPDDEVYHYVAGGFTALSKYPVPFRLYPNHAGDELAYALPEPDPADPSATAVGTPKAAPKAAPAPAPAAAPAAAPAPAAADAQEATK